MTDDLYLGRGIDLLDFGYEVNFLQDPQCFCYVWSLLYIINRYTDIKYIYCSQYIHVHTHKTPYPLRYRLSPCVLVRKHTDDNKIYHTFSICSFKFNYASRNNRNKENFIWGCESVTVKIITSDIKVYFFFFFIKVLLWV